MSEQTNSEQTKTTTDTTKKWYVIRAISGQEKKVKQYIEVEINRLGLGSYVSQILIPTEKIYQIRNGKKVSKERPFYSGYILIEASLVGEVPHVIKNTAGVIGFLGETKGGMPVPMRLSEVNRILGTVDVLEGSDAQINVPFIVGETVKVTNGPFNGFTGTVEKVNEEKKKLEVMVKIFGRKTPLELGYLEVEKES
jgi:transcriptional antiterminator NusG